MLQRRGLRPQAISRSNRSYREELRKLGAQILYTDERNAVAKLARGPDETWLKVYSQETDIDVVTVVKQALKLTLTPPSGPDYRLLGHMPNYAAGTPEKKAFDELGFAVRGEEEVTEIPAQGAKYVVAYRLKPGAEAASDAEIQENYRAALGLLGAGLLYTDPRTTVARLEQNGQTIWVRVYSQDGEIEVRAIEEKPFAAPALQAVALKSALEKEGRVALSIGFDGAKAALKPEAAKTVAEIVKLLKENPTLKLSIEGHTDDVGPRPFKREALPRPRRRGPRGDRRRRHRPRPPVERRPRPGKAARRQRHERGPREEPPGRAGEGIGGLQKTRLDPGAACHAEQALVRSEHRQALSRRKGEIDAVVSGMTEIQREPDGRMDKRPCRKQLVECALDRLDAAQGLNTVDDPARQLLAQCISSFNEHEVGSKQPLPGPDQLARLRRSGLLSDPLHRDGCINDKAHRCPGPRGSTPLN